MTRIVDLSLVQDEDGIFDLEIDPDTKDFVTDDGLETPIVVSLFSDRRAASDEVADPMRRRGWIGNQVAEVPGDNHGSGLWLYEQHRLTQEVATGVRMEAEQALDWMVDEGLVAKVEARVLSVPAERRILLDVTETSPMGGVTRRAYQLISATQRRALARLGT
jgi:phage gp46-like protein